MTLCSLNGAAQPSDAHADHGPGWPTARIRRVALSIKDGTHGTHERVDSGIPLLSAKNIRDGRVVVGLDESLVSVDCFDEVTRDGAFRNGDVLLTIVGSIGRVAVLSLNKPACFQRSVCSVRFGPCVHNRYAYYYFQSQPFQSALLSSGKASAQTGVYLGDVASQTMQLPSVSEQFAIADFLDGKTEKVDALMAKKQRLIELLQEKRTALISHAVTKGLGPDVPMKDSGIVSLGHVASHYDVRSFGRVASLQRGFDLPADDREAGVYPVVSSGGIVDTHSEGPVGGPGVVTGRYGSVGSVYWLESAFWPHNTALYVRDFWGNAPRFVYWLLLSLSAGIAAAESGKSAVPGLDQKDTRALQVAVLRRLRISWTRVCVASVSERKVSHGREELTVGESPRPRGATRSGAALEPCPQT